MLEEIVKRFKKQTTVQLLAKVAKLAGEELDACLVVLEQRGQDTSKLITAKSPRVDKKDSRIIIEIPADEELSTADQKKLDKEEKELAKAEKKSGKSSPKADVPKVVTSKPTEIVWPEGLPKGSKVTFKGSARSKNPGEDLVGVLKRYFFDKQDQGYYFLINVDGKEYCKKPNAVTAVK